MVVQENEIVALVLAFGVAAFILANYPRLRKVPGWQLLLASFLVALVSRVATVAEGFVLPDALNALEHAGHALAATLLAVWCWRCLPRREHRP